MSKKKYINNGPGPGSYGYDPSHFKKNFRISKLLWAKQN